MDQVPSKSLNTAASGSARSLGIEFPATVVMSATLEEESTPRIKQLKNTNALKRMETDDFSHSNTVIIDLNPYIIITSSAKSCNL
jgi:hypothetical protein